MDSIPSVSGLEGLPPELVERIGRPAVEAAGLPNDAYTSWDFLALERDRLFSPTWTCIGQACADPGSGRRAAGRVPGPAPAPGARRGRVRVRVFHNVCSHRGNRLVPPSPAAFVARIRCPYHAWTYASGRRGCTGHAARGRPRHGTGTTSLDRRAHGLTARARSAVWLDLVFVNPGGGAPPFERPHRAARRAPAHGLAAPAQFERMQSRREPRQLRARVRRQLEARDREQPGELPPALRAPRTSTRRSRLEDHYHYLRRRPVRGAGVEPVPAGRRRRRDRLPPLRGLAGPGLGVPHSLFPNVLHRRARRPRVVAGALSAGARADAGGRADLLRRGDGGRPGPGRGARRDRWKAWRKVFLEDHGRGGGHAARARLAQRSSAGCSPGSWTSRPTTSTSGSRTAWPPDPAPRRSPMPCHSARRGQAVRGCPRRVYGTTTMFPMWRLSINACWAPRSSDSGYAAASTGSISPRSM